MITIHIDYVDGTELSYIEGLEKGDNFTTNCLTFFSQDLTKAKNVQVVDEHGRCIDRNELMSNTGHNYTDREMRAAHNIYKMLVTNSFTWKQPAKDMIDPIKKDDFVKHSGTTLNDDGLPRKFKVMSFITDGELDTYGLVEIMLMSNGMTKYVKPDELKHYDRSITLEVNTHNYGILTELFRVNSKTIALLKRYIGQLSNIENNPEAISEKLEVLDEDLPIRSNMYGDCSDDIDKFIDHLTVMFKLSDFRELISIKVVPNA